jgi:hypothetical protein
MSMRTLGAGLLLTAVLVSNGCCCRRACCRPCCSSCCSPCTSCYAPTTDTLPPGVITPVPAPAPSPSVKPQGLGLLR